MANKFFNVTCKSKKSKHANGEVVITFPITASTQAEAKQKSWEVLETKDEQGTIEFFQVPSLEKITEEEYNELTLQDEAIKSELALNTPPEQDDKNWPSVNTSGFYDKDTDGILRSSVKLEDNIAEILVLQTAPENWVFGFRYSSISANIAKPTSHAQGDYQTIELAIAESSKAMANVAEFQSIHAESVDKAFADKVLDYDFGEDICSQLPDDEPEDQIDIEDHIEQQSKATLPNQIDVDVATFDISETKRIELAVMQKGEAWVTSFKFTDTQNPENDKGNIRHFLNDEKSTRENAITLAMGHAGNWLYQVDEFKNGQAFFKGNSKENFEKAISYAMVIEQGEKKEPLVSQETMDKIKEVGKVFEDKEDDHFIPTNEHELFVYNSLKSIDDAHLDLSPEQYEEAGEKLGAVLKEHETYNAGAYGYTDDHKFNKEKTLSNILEVDWDNSHEAIKVYLNTRSLRALFRENSEFDEPQETPSFQDWSKANKGKSFDDYAEKFNIDSTITTSENVEHPELLKAVIKRMQGEDCPVTPEQVHNALCTNITDQTDVKSLSEEVLTIKNASILWHSTTSVNLIQYHTKHPEQPSYDKVETKPKKEVALFDKENEWQLYAHQLLSINGEDEKATNQQYVMISGNIQSVFWATGNKLKEGEYYTETASHFMDLIRGIADVTPILMDARKVRELVNDILAKPEEIETAPIEAPTEITSQEPLKEEPIKYDDEALSNRKLWAKVCDTNPNKTKPVEYGARKFTAIDADYQIEQATNLWGSYGDKWGLMDVEEIERGDLIAAKATFFYPSPETGERVSFPLRNSISFRKSYMNKDSVPYFVYDEEYSKKLETNFLSRAFAKLGWNADVRQGRFEDDRYVNSTQLVANSDAKIESIERQAQQEKETLEKVKGYTDKFSTASSLAEIKRLEKLAIAALDALPQTDDETRKRHDKCLQRVKGQSAEALNTFNQDLKAHKEKA
ncbi:conserved hypothetical protein [Vibrio chagasii]|nr:conserved hypothetical protein [Vibrio chagasii]